MALPFKIPARVSAKMEPFNAKHEISRVKPLTCVVRIDLAFEMTAERDWSLHVSALRGNLIKRAIPTGFIFLLK